jgi:ring-1,2-phenylacetyl-CoA epoxidase subunit PaaD
MRAGEAMMAGQATTARNSATARKTATARARTLLDAVVDPEIPVLSVAEIGVLRDVDADDDGGVTVTITPTYSGCPAMGMIEMQIREVLLAGGFDRVIVKSVLSPPWSTDWLGEAARDKLRSIGIAPPVEPTTSKRALLGEDPAVHCPRCGSVDTRQLSRFGSTACKAIWACNACLEPFDYFKCI